MICPRCSFQNRRGTLACARCGETAPRPLGVAVESRPPAAGPRPGVRVGRELPNRSGAGLRAFGGGPAMTPPARLRPLSTPRWEHGTPRPPAPAMQSAPMTGEPAVVSPSADSAIHRAKTDPHWLQPPDEITTPDGPPLPLPLEEEEPAAVDLRPTMARRAMASFLDALVIGAAFVVAILFAMTVFGWHALAPDLGRGLDGIIDGMIVGHRLGMLLLGFLLVLGASYATVAHALGGATLGKALMGLRVVSPEGEAPRWSDSAWRSAISTATLAMAGLGVAATLVDPERIALHDRLVGTRLVRIAPAEGADVDLEAE